jgi:hypothetical protein
MTSIRKFTYATLLALSTIMLAPALAGAQEPLRGQFTLPHDVRWENAVVPAGDYQFSLQPEGPAGVLLLSKLSGKRTGFMFLVANMEETKPSVPNQLVLEAAPEGSYVSAMQLPEFGMTVHFSPPSHAVEKQLAAAAAAPAAGAQ